jgi:hypothetical protein
VKSVASEGRPVISQAANHGENGVEQRKARDQQRKDQQGSGDGAGAVNIDTQKRHAEAERSAAAVVRNYLFKIFEKLGVSTRVELVLYCLQEKQSRPLNSRTDGQAGKNGSNGA